jgi:chromosome segregation ATPase
MVDAIAHETRNRSRQQTATYHMSLHKMQAENQAPSKDTHVTSDDSLLSVLSAIIEPLKEQNLLLQQALEELRSEVRELRSSHERLNKRYNDSCSAVTPIYENVSRGWFQWASFKHQPAYGNCGTVGFLFTRPPS